jgi:hypothetical protein
MLPSPTSTMQRTINRGRGLWVPSVQAALACGLGLLLSSACGSEDSARQDRKPPEQPEAGAGGQAGDGTSGRGTSGDAAGPAAGAGGSNTVAGSPGEVAGGAAGSDTGGASGGVEAGGAAGASGAGGEAPQDCESVEPSDLQGIWRTDCNGYSCAMTITATGAVGNGCDNGQYEYGTLEDGQVATLGEGGAFAPYSTDGTFTRTACDTVTRDYVGQIPPNTGPEQSYSCQMTRGPACAPTLLQALAGVWDGDCGSSTCVTTLTAAGEISSTCSNGQSSSGTVEETGRFADVGSGGGFPDYSTTGVLALIDCDTFLMPYTWQMPPNTGSKTSAQCTYTRQVDDE